jgi:hypothetical protein
MSSVLACSSGFGFAQMPSAPTAPPGAADDAPGPSPDFGRALHTMPNAKRKSAFLLLSAQLRPHPPLPPGKSTVSALICAVVDGSEAAAAAGAKGRGQGSGLCTPSSPRLHPRPITITRDWRRLERKKEERKTYARCQARVKGALASKSHRGDGRKSFLP